jgi:citrate lyase beta subunit
LISTSCAAAISAGKGIWAAGNQIPVVNRLFTPSGADIAFGVFARAVGEGSAAIQVDGKLIGRHP